MRVLVIGSGGREHALIWKIAQSKLVDKIFSAPGNGGITTQAECINIKAEDIFSLLEFASRERIDLTVVGPELPLSSGIVDEFTKAGLKIFGPTKQAARLESSKAFAKELMRRYEIPTADFCIFDNPREAKRYINHKGRPCVVKADGLAAGKGVVVCKTVEEAERAVDLMMEERIFGEAGNRVIVEDCLEGEEASIIVFTDSRKVIPLASSQDHKRIYDNDRGANTGGMGAYSPAPVVTPELTHRIIETIIYPTIKGLGEENIFYKGILYVGIMVTADGPKVLEFNVRFGDPETQAILPRLNSDLVELMILTIEERLEQARGREAGDLLWDKRPCVCVVCSSAGYPGKYEKNKEIFGLEEIEKMPDIIVFHAGTKRIPISDSPLPGSGGSGVRGWLRGTKRIPISDSPLPYKYVTNGGRVLGITGLGNTIKDAIEKTYRAVERVNFDGMHYRKDIGRRAVTLSVI